MQIDYRIFHVNPVVQWPSFFIQSGASGTLAPASYPSPEMLTQQHIEEAVLRVVSAAREPLLVILFGSYARGNATEASDLDLLVVERNAKDAGEEMMRLHDAIGPLDVGVDLLVYSAEDFNKRLNWCSTPVYWAAREGKVLYDRRV